MKGKFFEQVPGTRCKVPLILDRASRDKGCRCWIRTQSRAKRRHRELWETMTVDNNVAHAEFYPENQLENLAMTISPIGLM